MKTVKRILLAGVLLLSLAMAMSPPALGYTTYTDSERATVGLDGGIPLYWNGAVSGALAWDNGNVSLPWQVGQFNHTNTKMCIHATGPVTLTGGFWNDRAFAPLIMTTGQWANETMTIAISNGFDVTNAYSHMNLTANNTDWEAGIYYWLDDAITLDSLITIEETDTEDPELDGAWKVNDTLTFGTMPFAMVTYMKIDYPSSVVSDNPDLYPFNGTVVDTADVLYVEYQKYGAFHDIDENDLDLTPGTGTVTVEFESSDEMEDATWTIDPTDEIWDGAFDGINMETLSIEVNGHDYDDWEAGSIVMENLDIDEGNNEFVFAWTAETQPPAEEPTADIWTQEAVTGVPNWALAAIGFIVVIAFIAIWKNEKKK